MPKYSVVMKSKQSGSYHFKCEADSLIHAIQLAQANDPDPTAVAMKARFVYPSENCKCQGFYRPPDCPVHGKD